MEQRLLPATLPPTTASTPRSHLLRMFGVTFGIAVSVGATIGGGILRTPGEIAALLPSVTLIMAVWLLGGLNALLGATAYSELGTMMPCAGGPYVFVRRALGDYAGFFLGYVNWVEKCATNAALALLAGEYSGRLLPGLSGRALAVALAVFMALVAMNWFKARWGGWFQNATTFAKLLGLGLLVVAAFVLPHPEPGQAATTALPQGLALATALVLAMQGVIFTYNGYYFPVYFGEEMRDPGRDIPRSMFRSVAIIIGMYLLLNAAFLWVIPLSELAHDPFAGGTAARILFGERGDQIITLIVIVSLLGSVNADVLAAPRMALDMGRDRLLPHQATRINRGGTPTVALALSALVAVGFMLMGSFESVLAVTASLMVANSLLMFVSVFVLRRREPDAPRPHRSWGYPWTTGAGLLIGLAFLVGVAYADVRHSLVALGIFAISYPIYRSVLALRSIEADGAPK